MSATNLPRTSRVVSATYTSLKLPIYKGNLLAEAMPPELEVGQLIEYMNHTPLINTAEIGEYSKEDKRLCADLLKDIYITPPIALDLYSRIRRLLFQGFRHRNPLDATTQQALFNLEQSSQSDRPWNQTAVPSLLYLAPSGKGKTTVVRNLIRLFPDVIEHTCYEDRQFYLAQPLFVAVDCPSNGSKRTLLERILTELDRLLGTSYYEDTRKKRFNVSDLVEHTQRMCARHCVGMIIVDELQNLRLENPKPGKAPDDVATLTFLDELFNKIGVPILLIGTWRCAQLLTQRLATVRRAGNHGRITEDPYKLDEEYWEALIAKLWSYQLCPKPVRLNNKIKKFIHYASAGLPALASQVLVTAQQLAIDLDLESVNLELLEHVYKKEMLAMHDALEQLRSGQFVKYEDLIPPKEILASSDRWSLGA